MHAHFQILQYSCQRIKVLHFSGSERLRKLGKGRIDEWSATILTQQGCSTLMLGYPGEDERGVLLINTGPGIAVTVDNSTTKQFQSETIIRYTLLEKFLC